VFAITIFEITAYIIGAALTILGTLSGILNKRLSNKAKVNMSLVFMILPFILCAVVIVDILTGAPPDKWPVALFFMPFTFLGICLPQYIREKRAMRKKEKENA